jgi:hypothetical protein
MDQFLEASSRLASQWVSILTVIVLILLIVLLIRAIILVGKVSKTTDKVNGTLDIVNDYLNELKLPVRVLVNISMSIEALRAASEETIRNLVDRISVSYKTLKEFLISLWNSILKKETDEEESEEIEIVTLEKTEEKEEE